MTKNRIQHYISRTFLGFAYLSVALQWLWVLTIGLPPLLETGLFDSFTQVAHEPSKSTQPLEFSPAIAIFTGIITLLFLIVTIVVIIKLPKAVSNTGEKIVHQTTEAIIPVITRNRQLPVKTKRILSRRITILLQLVLVLTPLGISFFLPPVQTITSQIITTLAIWLAGFSAICFVISWLIKPETISRTQSRVSRG